MAQSGFGQVRLFNDFTGVPNLVTETVDTQILGDFYAGGEGFEDNDTGVVKKGGTEANGVVTITSGNTDADTTFIGTDFIFKPSVNGPGVFETRVQLPDLDTKEIFFGITSILSIDEQLEDIVQNSSATAVTFPADGAGFYFSDELTASATTWHGFSAGGTLADQVTAATNTLSDSTVTANTWQTLRLTVDPDGSCEYRVDGDLKQRLVAAVAPTTLYAVCLAVAANTTEFGIIDSDFIGAEFARDWTA